MAAAARGAGAVAEAAAAGEAWPLMCPGPQPRLTLTDRPYSSLHTP